MADVEHPRPPYQHHAGFYRRIMPGDDLKPWEWTPVTDHSLPKSPMRPIFQIPKAYPPGLSGPVPSPTVAKIPNGCKKGGLWASIRRFLRIGECRYGILALFSTIWYIAFVSQSPVDEVATLPFIPVQQDYSVTKVQPCEWKQYGYWARPFLNNVECPNSRESFFSIEY